MCKLISVHESIKYPSGTIYELVTHYVKIHWASVTPVPSGVPTETTAKPSRNQPSAKINTKYGISQFRLGMHRSQTSQYIHQFTLHGLSESNLLKIFLLAKVWNINKNERLSREPNTRRNARLSTIGQLWPLYREVNFGARDSRFGPN